MVKFNEEKSAEKEKLYEKIAKTSFLIKDRLNWSITR